MPDLDPQHCDAHRRDSVLTLVQRLLTVISLFSLSINLKLVTVAVRIA